MAYVVYENRTQNYARVHIANCAYIKLQGGVNVNTPFVGWYHQGFETPEDALSKARSTGRHIRTCSNCGSLLPR